MIIATKKRILFCHAHKLRVFLVVCITFQNLIVFCQDSTLQKIDSSKAKSDTFHQMDVKDWMIQKGWRKPKPEKNSFFLLIPVIGSNPSTGFIFGLGLSYALKFSPQDVRVSAVSANATYSTKGQTNINAKSNLFVFHEKLVLNGDWRFMIFSEDTYGLGSNRKAYNSSGFIEGINGERLNEDTIAQHLKYDLIRFHEIGSWQLFPNIFAGIGFQFDRYTNIKDEKLATGDSANAFHYQYSKAHGFDPTQYNIGGWNINFLYDSRDNQVNAYHGYYANLNYSINTTAFGSSKASQILLLEYRSFHPLSKNKRHILGLWGIGNFVTSGDVPYLFLPAIGYDQRQKSGRGYSFGRFRGEGWLYGEGEYRFPISQRTGILGGVLFFNFTSTTDKANDVKLMEYVRPGYGGGIRFMADKKSRTRIQVDAGIANGKLGIYFGAQEAF